MVDDGDVVEIHYVGRRQDTGDIFDLTSAETAEEEDLDTEGMDLGPVKVLVGAEHVIPGLEDAIRDMDIGEERTVEVASEDAFGSRDADDIETFPRREFDSYDVTPRRGLVVEIDGRRGKIVSASSGRVRVDFNHPLAGKDLEYDVELLDVVDDVDGRVAAVLDYYGLEDAAVSVEDGKAAIILSAEAAGNEALTDHLGEEIELVNGVDAVSFETEAEQD